MGSQWNMHDASIFSQHVLIPLFHKLPGMFRRTKPAAEFDVHGYSFWLQSSTQYGFFVFMLESTCFEGPKLMDNRYSCDRSRRFVVLVNRFAIN